MSATAAPIQILRQSRIPLMVGVFCFVGGTLFLLAIYLGILTLAQGWAHAVQLLEQDVIWVALVATGFGAQLGLFGYQRVLVRDAARSGMLATGAGTGTSTLGMVACCTHHLTDIAPLIGLAGFGGVAAFLAEWKIPFIVMGLAVNAIGIVISLRNLRRLHT